MKQLQLILVGGFLGAGKTTLLARAAKLLGTHGHRVGLITNDQAADLVDTALLRQAQFEVREIAGGCFCCRFDQLITTVLQLATEISPDIIIGEPVGSCTDLSATVLQPLKDLHADCLTLAPFSVLVDPNRLWEVLEPRRQSLMHASARYILRKQLEEADLLIINKRDLLDPQEQEELLAATRDMFPGKPLYLISALTGEGVAAWLDDLASPGNAGGHIVDVDYDIYAEGEAVLGWLNASATLTATAPVDWQARGLAILDGIRQAAALRRAEIVHVKLSLTTPTDQCVANLTATTGQPTVRGRLDEATAVSLVINARVEMAPDALQAIIEEILRSLADNGIAVQIHTVRSLSPGRPMPTHRYASVK